MSSDAKKRKPKVFRSEEGKRSRHEEQEGRYYSEELELDLRDPKKDYELYKETCEDLHRLMAEIQDLKSKESKDVSAEIEERRIQSCVHFMTLKKLNRLAHIRLKKARDQTHEAKQKVDAYHLQLQNLLYEVMHLQKEITKCLEFKSKHEEIELVSVEEFYREAPPEICKPEITSNDPHQQTLARLDWELEQRKRLAEKYKESLASKEKILKEIDIKKEYLNSLQPQLQSIMQASLPVQEYLSMPFDCMHKQYETARHLPAPLYVLFVQAGAYSQACAMQSHMNMGPSQMPLQGMAHHLESNTPHLRQSVVHPVAPALDLQSSIHSVMDIAGYCNAAPVEVNGSRRTELYNSDRIRAHMKSYSQPYRQDKKLVVSIEGSVEEAKALFKPPEDSQDDESDSDAEEEQTTKRRRPTLGVQLDDKRKEMLKRHPLCVSLIVRCKDNSSLNLTFYFLMNLNILTVKAKIVPASELASSINAGELLNPDTVLRCLYPGDDGNKTPNPANQYQFDKVGILNLSDYISELGHPYLWVQRMGGLHFPTDQPQPLVIADNTLSASHMEKTIKLLRSRLLSRLSLHKQFASLEHGIIPVSVECQNLFPAKVVSRLTRWSMIPYEDYVMLPYTKEVVECGLAEDTHLYYSLMIDRGTAKLHGAVVLNPGYCVIPPLFSLCLNWKGERSSRNDENIRVMESEINVYYKELSGPSPGFQLLTNQLQRLCMLLDVYLETECHDNSVEGPHEFPPEKICLRLVKGPSRMKPFKYNSPQGFFSHR